MAQIDQEHRLLMSVVSSNESDVNATRYLNHCHFHRYQTSAMASDRSRIFSLPRLECVVRWPWTKRIWKSRAVLQSSRTQKFSATHAFVANKGLKSNVQKLTLARNYTNWDTAIGKTKYEVFKLIDNNYYIFYWESWSKSSVLSRCLTVWL